ncbi:MAG: hypothetical protein WCK54_18395 [Desulfuromonadales bacterium]
MNATRYEAIQKQIENILFNKFTPEQIADNYLSIPFVKRTPPPPDVEEKARVRLNAELKIDQRKDPQQLMAEIIGAVCFFEIPVLCDQGIITVPELDEHLDNPKRKLDEIVQDVEALSRVLNQPFSRDTVTEISKRRDHLQEVIDQGYIYISRQQEVALQWLSHHQQDALKLIKDFVLIRDPNQPDQAYTRALGLIVFRLLVQHAKDHKQTEIGRNTKRAAEIISALSPNLQKHITPRNIKQARTNH